MLKIRLYLVTGLLIVAAFTSCKKDKSAPADTPSKIGTRNDLTNDSIFLYAKETYLWYDVLPDYQTFLPRLKVNPDSTVAALTRYKLNPKYNLGDTYNRNRYLDKYSFIDDGSIAEQLGGTGGDFGLSVFYNSENDLRIKYVYDSSPAGLKGLKRGYQITKLNGRTDLSFNNPSNVNFVVNNLLAGTNTSVVMTVKSPGGSLQEVVLTKANYPINPVLYRDVFTVAGGKKVGYLVFNSFTTNASDKLQEAFQFISSENATELIVDLRYNGGGSVATAEELVNYIAPSSKNNTVMYTTYYNQLLQNGQATILKNQKFRYNGQLVSYYDINFSPSANQSSFAKLGNLNVSKVYFIVSGSTASASELVINSLKPVVPVQLVGRRTYGKPVGFFSIHIDKYDMYVPQFQTKNQVNEGDYFDGMPVNNEAADDVTKDFGDTSETLLAQALAHAATGSYPVTTGSGITVQGGIPRISGSKADELTQELDQGQFKGMITRFKLKRK